MLGGFPPLRKVIALDYLGKDIAQMSRDELLNALCDGDEDEYERIKNKRTTTLRKMLVEQIEDGAGELFPNGYDPDASDEDWF